MKPPKLETTHGRANGRPYCGRKSIVLVDTWRAVTCVDCHAARRADEAHANGGRS